MPVNGPCPPLQMANRHGSLKPVAHPPSVSRGVIQIRKTKNGEAPEIPMNSDVRAAFELLKAGIHQAGGPVFGIQDPKGWFESARAKAGVNDFRWHDCRHTFCSRLAMAGVPLKTVHTLAGHNDRHHSTICALGAQYTAQCSRSHHGGSDEGPKVHGTKWHRFQQRRSRPICPWTKLGRKPKNKKNLLVPRGGLEPPQPFPVRGF